MSGQPPSSEVPWPECRKAHVEVLLLAGEDAQRGSAGWTTQASAVLFGAILRLSFASWLVRLAKFQTPFANAMALYFLGQVASPNSFFMN
jgi:hypothetical protein